MTASPGSPGDSARSASRAVGLVLGSLIPPARLCETARLGEELGFDELWFSEDYFYTAGLSSSAAALSVTTTIPVGTGIVSALVRHPAVLAMEGGTIGGMFPGRFRLGVALGVPSRLRQMNVHPDQPLDAMRECITALRRLLSGATVSASTEAFYLDQISLAYPEEIPIYMGAIARNALRVAGAVADGTLVALLAGPEYVKWARDQIYAGSTREGRTEGHRVVVFAFFATGESSRRVKDEVKALFAWYVHANLETPALFDVYGISDDLRRMAADGMSGIERRMPRQWLDEFAVVGEPEECAEKIERLFESGADAVALYPMPGDRSEEMIRFGGEEILPRIRGRTERKVS